MPALPTFIINDAQAQRLLKAFGSAEAYQEWLKKQIVEFVLEKEMEADNAALAEKYNTIRAELLGVVQT